MDVPSPPIAKSLSPRGGAGPTALEHAAGPVAMIMVKISRSEKRRVVIREH
jgi:hypothetical protein